MEAEASMDVDPPMDAGPAMDELTDAVRVVGLAAGEEDGGDALGHEACMECGGETPVVLGEGRDLGGTRAGENATAPSPDDFDRFGLPSAQAVLDAGACELIGESGSPVLFSSLIHERSRVVVVFLRHLWCGLCQEYVVALKSASRSLSNLSLPTPGITTFSSPPPLYILLISSGSPSLIPAYRNRLQCPFPLYVDQSRKVYRALGMTRRTWDGGRDSEKGRYVTKGAVANFFGSTASGLQMPRYPGDAKQLGGEFVFASSDDSSSIECVYASRMSTTRNHSEVRELFAAAGVELRAEDEECS